MIRWSTPCSCHERPASERSLTAFDRPPSSRSPRRKFQKLRRFNLERFREPLDDLETGIKAALFDLAQITPADASLVRKRILRQPAGVAEAAQIGGKDVSQVHARCETGCLEYAPRYIEQNAAEAIMKPGRGSVAGTIEEGGQYE